MTGLGNEWLRTSGMWHYFEVLSYFLKASLLEDLLKAKLGLFFDLKNPHGNYILQSFSLVKLPLSLLCI